MSDIISITPLGGIILALLLAQFALERLAAWRNLRAWTDAPPPPFDQTRDLPTHRKGRDYLAARERLGAISSAVHLAALLLFWLLGGFVWLHGVAAASSGPIVVGLLFIGALLAADALLGLPFSLYSTFVIEQRFGFNRSDWRTFVSDRLKGALLGVLLGAPLLSALLAFFLWAGDLAWFYAWAAVIAFSLALQYIAPTWIMPLFNRFEPLADGPLKSRLQALCQRVGFDIAGLFVIDGSKRSSKANAFFTGFGKNRRIALFDTLIEGHDEAELEAVLAHEIGHYKRRHIHKGVAIGIAHTGLMLYLLGLALQSPALFAAFGLESMPVSAGLVFFAILFSPLEMAVGAAFAALSRKHEFEADRFAAQSVEDPGALARALVRLSTENLSHLTPAPLYVILSYSHPPLHARLAAIDAMESHSARSAQAQPPAHVATQGIGDSRA
ncbi:M48 family metallopeptidase [Magnetofaba australis]|uniref:Putative Ste24 endopeptidase n=1 Tax=Magnetofaba australis IT-1 TaxID=1434232 RepID=A0A1Y2K2N7_9PROT|nr:M48 family metallopeptidase [Magnetofaba australis]OSM02273.1 putative Ste24 endopeptidase [Magnetofaba australis IT-1]